MIKFVNKEINNNKYKEEIKVNHNHIVNCKAILLEKIIKVNLKI